jgi:hypothetical protein
VTLIGSLAEVEIEGVLTPLQPHDTTYIAQGAEHR